MGTILLGFVLQLCVEFLVKNISANSACDIIQAAVTYGQDDLKCKAVKYVGGNTQVSD